MSRSPGRAGATPDTALSGLLVLDKPEGLTSHSAVQRVRRALGVKRAGHAGTLDPLATGVLLVAVGRATRLLEYLILQDKAYRAEIRLGVRTETLDREGDVLETLPVPEPAGAALEQALARFRGPQRQAAPVFSAIKRGGQRLYQKARRGEAVEAPVRDVTVHRLDLVAWQTPDLTVDVVCSKGTYVRALARDLGEALGSAGTLWQLRRTRSGTFGLDLAVTLSQVQEDPQAAKAALLPAEAMVADLPRVTVETEAAAALARGMAVPCPAGEDEGVRAVFTPDGALLGIGQKDGAFLRPRKIVRPAGDQAGDRA
ncbi:MAG TPA: tRNA pseudouridine(55) synthase TruB [Deferrisomatales bacterium]|nr:tRNA pseudouridine(55) synthase TruB [Deferrisomatales bacterium]